MAVVLSVNIGYVEGSGGINAGKWKEISFRNVGFMFFSKINNQARPAGENICSNLKKGRELS